MSKTKEEYMELAYKDGLGGFFAQLNEEGATDYGTFDGTVTKQIPECAITSMKRHDAKTLAIDIVWDADNECSFKNPVWPAGLEKDDFIGSMVKVNKYYINHLEESSLCLINVVEESVGSLDAASIKGNWYTLYLSYLFDSEPLTVCYERSSGLVVFSDNRAACDQALTTYLDSLS